MKRISVLIALIAAGGLAVTAAGTGGAASSRPDRETLEFTFRMALGTTRHGPNPGDVHTFSGTLFQGSRTAGTYRGMCIVTDPGPTALQCNVTANISGRGEIDAVGDVGTGGWGIMTVVGGTGDFRGVEGSRTGRNPRREGRELVADLTYRLRR